MDGTRSSTFAVHGSRRLPWREVLQLARPRVTLVAALTGGPALVLGHDAPPLLVVVNTLAALVLLGAGCSALNAWIERDRDARMARTRNRPLPSRRLRPAVALAFGLAASAAAVALLASLAAAAAVLGIATLAWYLGAYTVWAKPRTAWSAVVGAVPGAAAPLIADAAAHGSPGTWGWTLFAIVFLWQPAHVWAIELFRRDELDAAGLPSMPARAGAQSTRRLMVLWIGALLPVTLAPWAGGALGPGYALVAVAAGVHFAGAAIRALRGRTPAADRRAFLASLVHVMLVFGAMLASTLTRWPR